MAAAAPKATAASNFANVAAGSPRPKQNATQNGPNSLQTRPQTTTTQDAAKPSASSEQHAHDRLLFLAANFVGMDAVVTLRSGEKYGGVFSCLLLDPTPRYLLKMVSKVTSLASQSNANGVSEDPEFVGYGEDHVMHFDVRDVTDLSVINVSLDKVQLRQPNGGPSGFRTDVDISGNLAVRERQLQRWEPEATTGRDSAASLGLNGTAASTTWDQFEANERLYGVKTDYDETFYTTTIDRSNPSYRERAAAADRIAREIESGVVTNAHIAEERGLDQDDGLDEEDRFSGVRREASLHTQAHSNRYTPPARRAPTGHSTVRGAPVDPAIISSQLVQPDSSGAPVQPRAQTQSNATAQAPSGGQQKENDIPTISLPPQPQQQQQPQTTSPTRLAEKLAAAKANLLSSPMAPSSSNAGVINAATATPAIGAQAGSTKTASQTVENDLLRSFKTFSAQERQRMEERERVKKHREKEVKLNDLRKFALNFKLKTEVPQDMLGILANSKTKQDQIVQKARKEVEEQQSSSRRTVPQHATPTVPTQQPLSSKAAGSQASSATASADAAAAIPLHQQQPAPIPSNPIVAARAGARPTGRAPQASAPVAPGIPTGPQSSRPSAGHLGERLMSNQQQRNKPFQASSQFTIPTSTPHIHPTAINTDASAQRTSATGTPTPSSATSTRFNAQAMEFKPNPAAVSFSPSRTQSRQSASPAVSRTGSHVAVAAVPNSTSRKGSFFGDKRPSGKHKMVKGSFNPLARLRAEAEKENKIKEYATNGGIAQAYRTPPTWDIPDQNSNKSYVDILDRVHPFVHRLSGSQAHLQHGPSHMQQQQQQHQPHQQLQNAGHFQMGVQNSQQGPHHPFSQQFPPTSDRPPFMEDQQRMPMQLANPGAFPSPRFQHGVVMPAPMMSASHSSYGQPGHGFAGPSGSQPVPFVRQLSNNPHMMSKSPSGHTAPVMMLSPSGGAPYMGMPPMQPQVPMYSPGPQHAFPQGIGHQTPGAPNGFPSPRPGGAPMMMATGSQQGHYAYAQPGQHQQMFPVQAQNVQHIPMRPGMGGAPQSSYNASPHMNSHFPSPPQQGRNPSFNSQGYNPHNPPTHIAQQQPQLHNNNSRPPTGANEDAK